jgi:hypothetical protein
MPSHPGALPFRLLISAARSSSTVKAFEPSCSSTSAGSRMLLADSCSKTRCLASGQMESGWRHTSAQNSATTCGSCAGLVTRRPELAWRATGAGCCSEAWACRKAVRAGPARSPALSQWARVSRAASRLSSWCAFTRAACASASCRSGWAAVGAESTASWARLTAASASRARVPGRCLRRWATRFSR